MGNAALDIGDVDERQWDVPLRQAQRVLTLIHDRAPSEEVAPEVTRFEQLRANVVLRWEARLLSSLAILLATIEAGIPPKKETLLSWLPRLNDQRVRFHAILDAARRLRKMTVAQQDKASLVRIEAAVQAFLKDLRRVTGRYRDEVDRLCAPDTQNTLGAQAHLMYRAALTRRGLTPCLVDALIDGDLAVPAILAAPPPHLADDPEGLLAFEDTIHDEVEAAAPHLMGEVILRWDYADAA